MVSSDRPEGWPLRSWSLRTGLKAGPHDHGPPEGAHYDSHCYISPRSSLSSCPTRSNAPPGARGSSFAGFKISAFVNPGVTSPVRARAVHQLGGAGWLFVPPALGPGLRGLGSGKALRPEIAFAEAAMGPD